MTTDDTPSRPTGTALLQRVPNSPVGSRRVEATLARMMSVFGVLFTLQTLPLIVGGWRYASSPLAVGIAIAVLGVNTLIGVATVLHLWHRWMFFLAGGLYLAALALWPVAVTGTWRGADAPWLFVISGVPSGFVVIASRGRLLPLVYLTVVGAAVTLLRVSPEGGSLTLPNALRDGAYAFALALAIFLIVNEVRRAARSVDRAQGTALRRYADAQVDEATESERVRTDALVHDAVLTTFLSAASAQTPEARTLAARMAQNAMNVLSRATVASHIGPKVAVGDLLDRVRRDAAGVGDRFEYSVQRVRDHFVPEDVADAVVSAAVQAMTNSVKHAGGPEVPRTMLVEGTESGGVRMSIIDRGKGFDPSAVASERLGLRVSILERMHRVHGEVELRTAPGRGTEFVLSWPASARQAAPADDAVAAFA